MTTYTAGYRKVGNAEHRRDKRLRLPIFSVTIGEQSYDTLNWSLGGLMLCNYNGYLSDGMTATIEIRLKDAASPGGGGQGGEIDRELTVEARVVRHDREKHLLALKFTRLTPTLLDYFERCFGFHNRRRR